MADEQFGVVWSVTNGKQEQDIRERKESFMVLTRGEVAKLAALARIDLSEDESDEMATQLDVILAAVASVGDVATQEIPPTSHAMPLVNVMREDIVSWTPNATGVLAGAPAVEDQRFRVPRILDDAEDE